MAKFTYDDFDKALESSGLRGNFSQYDLSLARQYPEFGMSMLSLKQDYNNAGTDEARALAHTAAETLRKNYGSYSGGTAGSEYRPMSSAPGSAVSGYEGDARSRADSIINELRTPGNAYESPYKKEINDLVGQIRNRDPFEWDLESDELWPSYRKQYLREGDRATETAIAQAAAMTGGVPSTAAVTAGTQAGDYYATQLSDRIPELEQRAYERYLSEGDRLRTDLNILTGLDDTDYQRQQAEELSRQQMLQNLLGIYESRAGDEYSRQQDQLALDSDAAQRMAELGDFSGYRKLGYSDEQIARMQAAWDAAHPAAAPAAGGPVPGEGTGTEPELGVTASSILTSLQSGKLSAGAAITLLQQAVNVQDGDLTDAEFEYLCDYISKNF